MDFFLRNKIVTFRTQKGPFDFNEAEDKPLVISSRLQGLTSMFERPRSVEMWRKSVFSWTDVDIQRQTRWVMCARRLMGIVKIEEDSSRKDLLAFAEQSFWHPVSVDRDNREESTSETSQVEVMV